MLQNLFLFIIIFSKLKQSYQEGEQYNVKFTPNQVMQTFNSALTDDYIKILAKDFASKAAAHFMEELNQQKQDLINKYKERKEKKLKKENVPTFKNEPEAMKDNIKLLMSAADEAVKSVLKTELDDDKALRLIQKPSPDGDHLDSSGEFSAEKNKIPVIQVTKINGVYFRRLLGLI